jgi:large subunit ribosomal protein L1
MIREGSKMAMGTRVKENKLKVTKSVYAFEEGVKLVKDLANAKFPESLEVHINLGIESKRSDQNVRGACNLPHGTGKTVKVAVFTQGDKAEEAKAAGADYVGFEDLAGKVKKGDFDADVVIASPDAMRIVGQLGQILGPKGLMPNPKVGTVTPNVAEAVKNAKAGQVRFRNDKDGIIHCAVGKVTFDVKQLCENIEALLVELQKLKPSSAKGAFIKKLSLCSTMGPGIMLDLSTISV